ncbi:MAG TPA: DUF4159 domain-containing protein [Candidatus Latescibacteria bacterium]|nr:hypothetical protein [Gemmatimonadaceae bacterium]MDP6015731.1 DUF4159 domain-containing protein [Candidatus Latescibacterota bacterium]HJP29710.1 DUF4159 domain-containing protein [Candidatus Latescibacterota bacterium]
MVNRFQDLVAPAFSLSRLWPLLILCALPACAPLMVPVSETTPGGGTSSSGLPRLTRDESTLSIAAVGSAEGSGAVAARSMEYLLDVIESNTDLRVTPVSGGRGLAMGDEDLADVPVVYSDGPLPVEAGEHLAAYLLAGGFFVGDLRGGVEEGLQGHDILVQGDNLRIELLEGSHPLLSCYYDLRSATDTAERRSTASGKQTTWETPLKLKGYFVLGRLAGIGGEERLSLQQYAYQRTVEGIPAEAKAVVNALVYAHLQSGQLDAGEGILADER